MLKRWLGVLCLALGLLVSSGCALFLIGAGGAGGYMLRKGEEGGGSSASASSSSKQTTSETQSKPTAKGTGGSKSAATD